MKIREACHATIIHIKFNLFLIDFIVNCDTFHHWESVTELLTKFTYSTGLQYNYVHNNNY